MTREVSYVLKYPFPTQKRKAGPAHLRDQAKQLLSGRRQQSTSSSSCHGWTITVGGQKVVGCCDPVPIAVLGQLEQDHAPYIPPWSMTSSTTTSLCSWCSGMVFSRQSIATGRPSLPLAPGSNRPETSPPEAIDIDGCLATATHPGE